MGLSGDERAAQCARCKQVFGQQDESTKCRSCGKEFHLECAGVTERNVNYGCEGCFGIPGNSARMKFRDQGDVGGLERAAKEGVSTQGQGGTDVIDEEDVSSQCSGRNTPVHQSASRDDVMMSMMRQQTAILERQMEMLRSVVVTQSTNVPQGVPPRTSTIQRRVSLAPSVHDHARSSQERDETYVPFSSTVHEDLALNVTRISTSEEFMECLEEAKRGPPDSRPSQGQPPALPRFEGGDLEWLEFIAYYLESTQEYKVSDLKNVERLRAALGGEPLRILNNTMIFSSSLPDALDQLRISYGDPDRIIAALEREMALTEAVTEHGNNLQKLLVKTKRFVNYVEACGSREHLNNKSLLNKLVDKLPFCQAMHWGRQTRQKKQLASLKTFAEFLQEEFMTALSVGRTNVRMVSERKSTTKKVLLAATVDLPPPGAAHSMPSENVKSRDPVPPPNPPIVCSCCKGDHRVWVCDRFLKASDDDRWKVVESERLCWTCLRPHQRRQCRVPDQCKVDGCTRRHHRLLHAILEKRFNSPALPNMCALGGPADGILFKVLPIKVHSDNQVIDTFAFIDEGSSVTLLAADIAEALGVRGKVERLTLSWTNGKTQTDRTSQRLKIHVSGVDDQKFVLDNVRTVRELELPEQTLRSEDVDMFCENGEGPVPYQNARPGLLIGLRHAHLVSPREVREHPGSSVVALRTKLGWVVYGSGNSSGCSGMNFRVCHMSTKDEPELENLIKMFYDVDSFGVRAAKHRLGKEQENAMEILQKTVRDVGERYEAGLLWREDVTKLPESRSMCLQRAEGLQRRMGKEPELADKLQRLIDDHLQKGYCVDVSHLPPIDPHWYLPVFPVFNPKKPDKVRLVYDAAAKNCNGLSLNSFLMSGPDLLTPLPEVLIRFREKAVAVSADIREMFHQVRVRDADKDAQRFLWWTPGEQRPRELRLEVMTFGATCSPTTAQYVMKQHAKKFQAAKGGAVHEILHNYYVDDELSSFNTVEEALAVMRDVVDIQKQAGFDLLKFMSSHPRVVESLSRAEGNRKEIATTTGSVLGMLWDCETDQLQFAVENVLHCKDETKLTRRKMLSGTMSLFDPLGLVANVVVKAKLIMKQCLSLQWDEAVPHELVIRWREWCCLLESLKDVPIPRFLGLAPDVDWELHTFVDASEEAYAAVSYVRGRRPDGKLLCKLVMGKTRVAPVRATTMPRMELLAAVLGARLADTVKNAFVTPLKRRVFWTDSMDCLCWIRSSHRRYHPFVAARVNEILELSEENSWRWVPTDDNVADDATRFKAPLHYDRWLNGPSFLYSAEEDWPKPAAKAWQPKEEVASTFVTVDVCLGLIPDVDRFSRWRRLLNATAYCLRFFLRTPGKMLSGPLTPAEIERAEEEMWRSTQRAAYNDLIVKLQKNPQYETPRSHPLHRLCVFLDSKNILRVNGRLPRHLYPEDIRCPIVVPSRGRVTELFVMSVHERLLHANHATVINEICRHFYVPGLRNLVKKIVRSCMLCRTRKPRVSVPKEGPLPEARVAVGFRAFTYCGVDYFGPFEVVVGRRREKRWGVLFTCMTTRAVHLEVAHSLSAESCIMCVRMFCARRDVVPVEMRSDCGTNFIATAKEMRKLADVFPGINWKFNPPAAPHMGGAWERMVQTVKRCLKNVIAERPLTDEILRCALIESEWVVNKHPLTHVPVAEDAEPALTPCDFLYGAGQQRSDREVIVGLDEGGSLRKSWRLAQQIADHFWKRFEREMVPILNLPTKWYQRGEPLRLNDAVMVADDTKRGAWRRGRVVEVIENKKDGQVRQARILTANGLVLRPVVKLGKLDIM